MLPSPLHNLLILGKEFTNFRMVAATGAQLLPVLHVHRYILNFLWQK
jgi:hypothetical protein